MIQKYGLNSGLEKSSNPTRSERRWEKMTPYSPLPPPSRLVLNKSMILVNLMQLLPPENIGIVVFAHIYLCI